MPCRNPHPRTPFQGFDGSTSQLSFCNGQLASPAHRHARLGVFDSVRPDDVRGLLLCLAIARIGILVALVVHVVVDALARQSIPDALLVVILYLLGSEGKTMQVMQHVVCQVQEANVKWHA
jgi:hypothetical protein